MDQMEAFLAAAEANRKADIVTDAITMRNATQATKNGFTEFVRSLSFAAPKAEQAVKITPEDVSRLKALFGQKR